jgi:hypothetical protein
MIPALAYLISAALGGGHAPEHLADLRRSGLTDETIRLQKIRSVPPSMIGGLLGGFDITEIRSAYILPFADPIGGWMDHVRLKVFPTLTRKTGTVKYLQPRGSGLRLFFPLASLDAAIRDIHPLYLVEGEKKALAVAQLGLSAVGFCGIEGWHVGGSRALLVDFDVIPLRRRIVELVPDGDVVTNPAVRRGTERFAQALEARGAHVRLVRLPGGQAI